MKNVLALMLIVLMAFAVGCVTDSNDDKDNDGGSSTTQSASTYFPLVDGATWSYTEISSWAHEGMDAEYDTTTYTMTVGGTSVQNSKSYTTLTVGYDGSTYTSDAYIRIDGDDVYMYDPNWALKPAVSEETAEEGDPEEYLAFKFKQSPGHSWTIESSSSSDEYGSYSYTNTGTYYGLVNVTTAAGTFTNCARFDQTTTDSYTYDGETDTSSGHASIWLAPNVGLVKQSDTYSGHGGLFQEIMETECTSYSIPSQVASN